MRRFGERVAHFSRRAIREESHRVDVFASRPGGDENRLAREIVAQAEHVANFLRDRFRGSEAARAGHAAGEIAFVGINHMNAASTERREIFLRRGVLPHVHIHRGCNNHGSFRSEIQRGEKILGDAVREFSEDVGSGGRDQQKIDALRDGDMFDGAFDVGGRSAGGAKHVGDYFLPGECRKRERRDKFLRRARHHHLHVELFLLQAAHQFSGLIGRHSSGDAQCNLHRIGGGQLLPPLSVLIFILGPVHRIFRFIFEETLLQFLFGNARGLARLRVINHRPPAHHQLPGAARRDYHVGKLAIRCLS